MDESETEVAASVSDEPVEPELLFINLLPWGEVDFSRGEFTSVDACDALVRAFPNFSFYTTPERCEPIPDPVFCTVWQDDDDPQEQIGCYKGVGGCEVELRRHDLVAESGRRTIASRCEPFTLADAWEHFQVVAPDQQPAPPR